MTAPGSMQRLDGLPSAALHHPMLGIGQVRHARLRPRLNCFTYPTYLSVRPSVQKIMKNLKSQIGI